MLKCKLRTLEAETVDLRSIEDKSYKDNMDKQKNCGGGGGDRVHSLHQITGCHLLGHAVGHGPLSVLQPMLQMAMCTISVKVPVQTII